MTRLTEALAVIGVALTVVLVVVIDRVPETRPSPSPTISSSAVAYGFPLPSPSAADGSADITALEARVKQGAGAPQDLTELASLYLRRAQATANVDDYALAESTAKRSLELLAEPNAAPLTLAKVASARHEFREAIAITTEYLKKSNSTDARIILATAYLALGELPAAAEAAEAAVAIKPSTGTYLMRALVMQAQGRDVEAGYDFSRAVAVEAYGDPLESARARVLWGRFVMRRGDLASANVLYEAALKIVPDYALANDYRGEAALRAGHISEARALFEKAFLGVKELRYLMDEARATELAGDAAGADTLRVQVERLVRGELEKNGLGHRLDLVEILVDRGRPADLDEAIALGKEEVGRRPSADTRFQLARAYARKGSLFDAQMQTRAALASGVHDARLYELAGEIETALENPMRGALYQAEAKKLDSGGSKWRTLGISVVPLHKAGT
jgi:Tfp pilus assembly protein PilF